MFLWPVKAMRLLLFDILWAIKAPAAPSTPIPMVISLRRGDRGGGRRPMMSIAAVCSILGVHKHQHIIVLQMFALLWSLPMPAHLRAAVGQMCEVWCK